MGTITQSDQNSQQQHNGNTPLAESGLGRERETIYYADGLKNTPRTSLSGMAVQIAVWGILATVFVLAVVLLLIGVFVDRHFGRAALWWYVGLAALVIGLTLARLLFAPARRAYAEGMELVKLPLMADEAPRVRCIGSEGRIKRLGPIPTDPFEPVIVRALLVDRPSKAFIWTWVVTGMLAVLMLTLGLHFAGSVPGAKGSVPLGAFGYFYFAFGGSVGALSAGFLFPAYIRIAPGRIDVLKFPFLGRGKPAIVKHDVRNDRVTVILKQMVAVVQKQNAADTATVTYLGTLNRAGVARAILAAAISEYPTPPLPDDALIG